MNIYLDINGVLLTKDLQPAKHLNKFLTYITGNFNVYWLTTHCKGDATATIQYLANHLDDDLIKLAKKIHPTNWSTLKTEAIDWNTPFLWFDDYLLETEKNELSMHNALNNWIKIDLSKSENALDLNTP